MMLCLGINAQNQYVMKILKTDGTTVEFNVNDIQDVTFDEIQGPDPYIDVPHHFDLFGQIAFYESLRPEKTSLYRDYDQTREAVFRLKPWLDAQEKDLCLTHIDAVRDNFLFCPGPDGSGEALQLLDWEYAGMQDPHVDLAMFAIYAFYDRGELDHLIDLYFEGSCPAETRIKIYAYVAVCGLLWSNWCEYKSSLGVEFGEYSLRQYRYAKDFCRLAEAERERLA